jgi:ketosteroid isomerase-like protein
MHYPGAEADIEIVKNATFAYAKGDWEVLGALMDPKAVCYYFRGVDSIPMHRVLELWQQDRVNIDSISVKKGAWLPLKIPDGSLAGNYVFQWNQQTVYYKDGKSVFLPYHTVNKVEKGRLKSVHFFYDQMKVMAQLGYKVIPPPE